MRYGFLTWIIVGSIAVYVLQGVEHRRRVRLLGSHLAPTQIEKLMGGLIEGYMRALDEKIPSARSRSGPFWTTAKRPWPISCSAWQTLSARKTPKTHA